MNTTASRDGVTLQLHQHGKGRVRMARTWREGDTHYFVEWTLRVALESAMERAFTDGDNTGMTPTDTCKNTCYFVAKQCSQRTSPELYAIKLASHFIETYPLVSRCKVWLEETPWRRVYVGNEPHEHGFSVNGTETHTVFVSVDKSKKIDVTSGIRGWKVLKTTQSGYEGYLKDKYTMLPETNDRIVATEVTATWKYAAPVRNYSAAYEGVKAAMVEAFFGPSKGGVYSPSVQYTLFEMARMAIDRVAEVGSVYLSMPNLHFVPCSPPGCEDGVCTFQDDVYVATSEPHGQIEACVTRNGTKAHMSRL